MGVLPAYGISHFLRGHPFDRATIASTTSSKSDHRCAQTSPRPLSSRSSASLAAFLAAAERMALPALQRISGLGQSALSP